MDVDGSTKQAFHKKHRDTRFRVISSYLGFSFSCQRCNLFMKYFVYIFDFLNTFNMDEGTLQNWSPYAKNYDPLKAGSIDGTDTEPHDKAISRAILRHYEPPHNLESKPERTIFVARFGSNVNKNDLKEFFSKYGDVISAKVIVDIVTGLSQGYGFVEMKSEEEAKRVLRRTTDAMLKGYKIFIDYECGRSMKGWKPRRLGGGFGGKKESGQLRFGGRDRPFKRPIVPNILKSKR